MNLCQDFLARNKQVYETMWGPSEFFATGVLAEWDVEARLGEIEVPTPNGHERQTLDLYLPTPPAGRTWAKPPAEGYNLRCPSSCSFTAVASSGGERKIRFARVIGFARMPPGSRSIPIGSASLEAALNSANVPVTFYPVKGGGHGEFDEPRIGQMVTDFLAQRLRSAASR